MSFQRPTNPPCQRGCSAARIDAVQEEGRAATRKPENIYLELSAYAINQLRAEFPTESKNEIQAALAEDINAVCGVAPYQPADQLVAGHYTLYGANYSLHVGMNQSGVPDLTVINARKLSPSLLEKRREFAYPSDNRFVFGRPIDLIEAKRHLLNLQEQ